MTARDELHKLIDYVPEANVDAARKVLPSLMDPFSLSLLNAPPDDEPETDEEREAVERALADPRSDIPLEEVLREYGLGRGSQSPTRREPICAPSIVSKL